MRCEAKPTLPIQPRDLQACLICDAFKYRCLKIESDATTIDQLQHGIFGVPKSAILEVLERVILTTQEFEYEADRD